jgi:ADP-ribose pyrophosphatase YjhB (NUDIX family)
MLDQVPPKKISRLKGISVMALIEDAFGNLLFVKQAAGKRLWALPGGKMRGHETLLEALRREILEEIGLRIKSASLLDIYDRPEKTGVIVLYEVRLESGDFVPKAGEIEQISFRGKLPSNATASAKFFWRRAQRSRK